ncbi:MAG: hypothetical protein U1D06_14730 [Paracoccaceae bacterium]|nr:hypothetical protein [Paracoccaceae bacterium]
MALPLITPLRDIACAAVGGVRAQAITGIATAILAVVAVGFLTAAGFVALAREIGMVAAAVVFSAIFALAAVAAHLVGRAIAARQSACLAAARRRAEGDIALAGALVGPVRPFLPLVAFLAAFALARRP